MVAGAIVMCNLGLVLMLRSVMLIAMYTLLLIEKMRQSVGVV